MEIIIAVIVIAGVGLIAGIGLSIASEAFAVQKDELVERVREALPGANCGACGYAGCDSYAEAVAKGESAPNKCAPGGSGTAQALSEILGVQITADVKKARVLCHGKTNKVGTVYLYNGMKSCAAATALHGGPSACNYGCIGFGDCTLACNYNAIAVTDGVAAVDTEHCVGCGMCVTACPKQIIEIVSNSAAKVSCSNHDKGAMSRKICTVSCIGCTKCVKECPQSAITMEHNLAVVNPSLCTLCGKCVAVCPQNCIVLE